MAPDPHHEHHGQIHVGFPAPHGAEARVSKYCVSRVLLREERHDLASPLHREKVTEDSTIRRPFGTWQDDGRLKTVLEQGGSNETDK